MAKPKILIQFDSDPHASVFDAVTALDAGVEHLLSYHDVEPTLVRELVHGAIFTRGPADLKHTAIFIGGSNVAAGENLLRRVVECFFGPLRVSVLMDANGANTTAAAAVLTAARHVPLAAANVAVLGATGPVGQRVVRLLAREGAAVRACSRERSRAEAVCRAVAERTPAARLDAFVTGNPAQTAAAVKDVDIVVAAGAAGAELLTAEQRAAAQALRVAIDLNAVPPVGLAGVAPTDKGARHNGVVCYGAIGVGGLKMKIHRAAIEQLFTRNDLVLDAEEVLELGRELAGG